MPIEIKKDFQAIYELLEQNANKKVSSVLPQLLELMTRKGGMASTCKRDEEGNVTHIFCYYHKEWESVAEVEYGTKASSTTGLNTMCKIGANSWSKQQRTKKKEEAELLDLVQSGAVAIEDIASLKLEIEERAKVVVPRDEALLLACFNKIAAKDRS